MSDKQSESSPFVPHPEEHGTERHYTDPTVPGPSPQSEMRTADDSVVVASETETEAGERVMETVPSLNTAGLIASPLRQTTDSVSERLLTLAQTDESPQDFTDDVGESSGTAFNGFPVTLSSGSIIVADENSISPVATPDESSIQGIFRETRSLPKSEETEQIDPQSPPRVDRLGLEALSSSPRPPKQAMEQPWETAQHLPDLTATETPTKHSPNHGGDENTEDGVSPAQRLTRLLVCCVVVLALFLSLWFMPDKGSDNNLGSPGILVTLSPTTSGMTPKPTQQPSSSPPLGTQSPTTASATIPSPTTSGPVQQPSSSPTFGTPSPTNTSEITTSPTFAPTASVTTRRPSLSPTLSPITNNDVNPPTTDNFTSQASFQGASNGTRLGLVVSMDPSGTFFASLDGRGNVQLYQQDSTTSSGWTLLSTVVSSSSTEPVESLDLAVVNGLPQVAMASQDSIQVLQYRNDTWNSMGDVSSSLMSSGLVAPTVALSSSGTTLAMASLENGGSNWNVEVWDWNNTWMLKGSAVIQNTTSNPFLSLSLDVSGDGETFVIGDWTIDALAVNVYVYRWNGERWSSIGNSQSFSWGPVDVTMRNDGNGFAVATPIPSSALVYEWNETIHDWKVVGNDLLGGSAIALADNGRRVVVGSPLASIVSIYDQSFNGSWQTTAVLNSTVGDQFGSSISIGGDGNVVVVGSPLDDQGGTNAGQVRVYA